MAALRVAMATQYPMLVRKWQVGVVSVPAHDIQQGTHKRVWCHGGDILAFLLFCNGSSAEIDITEHSTVRRVQSNFLWSGILLFSKIQGTVTLSPNLLFIGSMARLVIKRFYFN